LHIELAATPGHDSLVLETQTQTAQRNFEPGCTFIIANEQICHAQCKWVKRAAGGDAKLTKARPAKVLHRA
jgi:hypothetical protein